jgi:cytochrome c-type biogenesis protein CcmH/NrfG
MLENFLENLSPTNVLSLAVVTVSLGLLVYFLVKTLITANLFEQGVNYYQAEDYPSAEIAFRKVIAINSTNDVVRLLLGETLNKQNRITEATELFQEVISRSPKNPQAYLRLANILMQQEQSAEAIANMEKAQELLKKQRQPEAAARLNRLLDKMNS